VFPAIILIPIFVAAGAFWAFGPEWSWVPFNALFWFLAGVSLMAGPSQMAIRYPSAAQSVSGTFSLTLLLSIGIAVALFFYGRYWELVLCAAIFLVSGQLWPRLRSIGPI
jgi:hypothetical protein